MSSDKQKKKPSKKKSRPSIPSNRWPHNAKKKSFNPQNHDDPQPRTPEGTKQRGGQQSAEELRNPPRRPGPRGGTLRSGGTNKGGRGATPRLLRERCRKMLAQDRVFQVPLKIIKDPYALQKDKLKAWALLAQFGGLASLSITDNDGNAIELPAFVVQAMHGQATEETPAAPHDDADERDDATTADADESNTEEEPW